MSTVTERFISAEFLFRPSTDEKTIPAKPDEKSPTTVCEPERRLWKVSTSESSTKFATIELCVLVFFLILACTGIVAGFAELSHLMQSDSVGHIAAQAINGGS